MIEEFKIPKYVNIPLERLEANEENARWILRNIFRKNYPSVALEAKAVVRDWMARNNIK